jgi:hypothetical protein
MSLMSNESISLDLLQSDGYLLLEMISEMNLGSNLFSRNRRGMIAMTRS